MVLDGMSKLGDPSLACSTIRRGEADKVQVPVLQLYCGVPVEHGAPRAAPHRGAAVCVHTVFPDVQAEVSPRQARAETRAGRAAEAYAEVVASRYRCSHHFSFVGICKRELTSDCRAKLVAARIGPTEMCKSYPVAPFAAGAFLLPVFCPRRIAEALVLPGTNETRVAKHIALV